MRLHAGYGIKTQSSGARASNRTSVVFAVLFKFMRQNYVLYLLI